MKPLIKTPRGTADILPEDQSYWRFVEGRATDLAERFGYERIDTPVFENADLFVRGVGEATDIVEKETYNFYDRGGDKLSLRPEGTAAVCRAYLQHGMQNLQQPVRLYYLMSMYRYERPQAGRFREFRQFGVEAIGDPDPAIDAEVIEFASLLLQSYQIQGITLQLNSIGDIDSREAYTKKLTTYFKQYQAQLPEEDIRRLNENPLRLLDSKEEAVQALVPDAPKSLDNLSQSSQAHWNKLLDYLAATGIKFETNHRLVRGLDYYTRTVFEFIPSGGGSQSTVLAGGRYDGLIGQLGGKPTPGIGFAMGIDRVIRELKERESPSQSIGIKILFVHLGEPAKMAAMSLASMLRRGGFPVLLAPSGRSLKSQLRYGSSLEVTHALIIGEEELRNDSVMLKNFMKSEQQEVRVDELLSYFRREQDIF